jgi:hypothetical protein
VNLEGRGISASIRARFAHQTGAFRSQGVIVCASRYRGGCRLDFASPLPPPGCTSEPAHPTSCYGPVTPARVRHRATRGSRGAKASRGVTSRNGPLGPYAWAAGIRTMEE